MKISSSHALAILLAISISISATAADGHAPASVIQLASESDEPLSAAQLDPLVRDLWSDPDAAAKAVEAFALLGPKAVAVVAAIVPGMVDSNTPRAWTFGSSGPHGVFHEQALLAIGPTAVPALCQLLTDDASDELGSKICKVLSEIMPLPADRERYAKTLLRVRDAHNTISPYAITGLAKGLGYNSLHLAIPSMPQEQIRQSKVYSPLGLAMYSIRPVIDQAIADGVARDAWWTAELQARLLANLGDVDAERGGPSQDIIELFVLAGDDAIAPRLLNYVRNAGEGGLAADAAWALGELGQRKYLSDVLNLLTRISPADLYQADYRPIVAAEKLGGKEAIPTLKTLLKAKPAVAAQAALSLSRIPDSGATTQIRALFEAELKGGWELEHFLTAMLNLGESEAAEQAVAALLTHTRWALNEPEYVSSVILNSQDIDLRHRGIRLLAGGLLDDSNALPPRVAQEIRDAFAAVFSLADDGTLTQHQFRHWWVRNHARFLEGQE